MDALRCQYTSKPCEHPRSFKDDGALHRLCVYHRMRANDAQRRWHSRQRAGVEMISDSGAEVSERTKRRRRAAEAAREAGEEVGAPRRRRRTAMRTAKLQSPMATLQAPASPPCIDSTSFSAMLHAPFAPEPHAISMLIMGGDDQRLSAEDLALLDELLLCIDDTKPEVTATDALVDGFFDSAWPPVGITATNSAPFFI